MYFKTQQLSWGNHGFLCGSNIGKLFLAFTYKKGNAGPQILSCYSLTQHNLDFHFHENVFKGAGVIQLLNLTRNIVSCS